MFLFKRGKYYHVEYFDEKLNKIRRISTGESTKEGAIRFVRDFQKNLSKNFYRKIPTLKEFYSAYVNYVGQSHSKSYLRSIDLSFKMFQEFRKNPTINDIKVIELEQFFALTFRRAKYSAHMYLRTLKAAFNTAVKWGYISENPFSKIKLPKIQKKLPVYIKQNDFEKLISLQENLMLKNLFILAYNTGMRLSELTNLKWDAIDLENKFIIVQNTNEFTTKSKKERIIPIHNNIMLALAELKKLSQADYVFCNEIGIKLNEDYVSKNFKRSIKELEFNNNIKFHSLRHSFASSLAQKGVSLYIIKELLGHEDISTTQIYAHLDRKALVEAVRLLE